MMDRVNGARWVSWKRALALFLALRLFLTLWGGVVTTLVPLPATPDEELRPYLGAEILREGAAGLLLGPWQRFDTNRYVRIARQGYAAVEDSVFPPLYPLLIRAGAWLIPAAPTTAAMMAAMVVSNLACLGAFYLFHRQATRKIGESGANRALVYLGLFPTGFFLFAGYTEPLFLLLALASLVAAERGEGVNAGIFALLATVTRTTGVLLILPLAYAAWTARPRRWSSLLSATLPAWGFLGFLLYRHGVGLPPIGQVYARFWHQTTSLPGADLITAARILLTGRGVRAGEFTLLLDFGVVFLLLATIGVTFRRFGPLYGLYAAAMLLFMLLPRSDLKPLYSFMRYALAFFPLFWWWGVAGQNPWRHRLILYLSLLLWFYFSGQFFIWGWVA